MLSKEIFFKDDICCLEVCKVRDALIRYFDFKGDREEQRKRKRIFGSFLLELPYKNENNHEVFLEKQ